MKTVIFSALFLIFLLATFPMAAQEKPGTVSGILKEQRSGQPVGYANVVLFPLHDSTQVAGGAMTAENGAFRITGLAAGQYRVRVSLVGFATRRLPPITISPDKAHVQLGTIALTVSSTQLNEVQVQGERPAVSFHLDRKVINVAKDLSSIAGTATDVMKNVPSVTVDADGNISMRGSGNLRILIDGRPTGLVANDQAQILEQIPASSIESVEVITNPSSKFEAEGEGGIINIILKKERNQGYNGLASLNVGTNNRYNASVSGNYRRRQFNLFGSYDFRQDNRNSLGSQQRFVTGNNEASYLDQRAEDTRSFHNNAVKAGLDFSPRPGQTLTGTFQYRNRLSDEEEFTRYQLLDANRSIAEHFTRSNAEQDISHNLSYQLGYRRTLPKKQELTADIVYTTATGTETQDFRQQFLPLDNSEPPVLQRSDKPEHNNELTLQTDYTHPLGEHGRFDAGYKSVISRRDDNYIFEDFVNQTWVNNRRISNRFIFDQQVHALYATYGNKQGKTSYQLGGRLEQTRTKGRQTATGITAPDSSFLNFFPSVFLTREITPNNQFQLSYSRRINRAGPWILNPFRDQSDPLNPRQGNPGLQPEFSHALEFSQIHYSKNNGSLNTTLFFRQTNNVIQQYRVLLAGAGDEETGIRRDTVLRSFINLASRRAYGLELTASQTLYKIWKLSGNVSAFRNVLTGNNAGTNLNNRNFSYTARLNSVLTFWKDLDLQVSANYRSPILLAQGVMEAVYFTELAMKKDILKKKGSLTFRLNDIFNTMAFTFKQSGAGFQATNYHKRQSRIAFIGFSYRFGDMTGTSNKQRNRRDQQNTNDEDIGDLN